MIKVKEFLDRNFLSKEKSTSELKKNGHYEIYGSWSYPTLDFNSKFYIDCRCNNETLRINVFGKKNLYSYFQTYQHIPRGEADINGYYQRSTDAEIIRYIESYMLDRVRDRKLNQLLK